MIVSFERSTKGEQGELPRTWKPGPEAREGEDEPGKTGPAGWADDDEEAGTDRRCVMAQRGNEGDAASSGEVKKRPTIEMVAERAGVSRQTVSNAANAPHRLRPETLQRVLGTIDELGYRPSHAARSLRTRNTGVIGCRLLPSNYGGTGGVLDRLIHALCDAARSSGYNVLAFSVGTDDEEIGVFDDLLRRNAVDGFVLANTHHGDVRPNWLLDQGARFVAFGRPWGVEHPRHSWVDVDGARRDVGGRQPPRQPRPHPHRFPRAGRG